MDEHTRNMTPSAIPGLNPVYEDYARCIHCGLCLNACPTYRLWNLEADSPRGRIHQMIHVEQGNFPVTDSFVDHIDKCLDCRACETACPSAVEYGKLVEYARARIERDYHRPLLSRIARDIVYRRLLPHPGRIAKVARLLRFYQRSGLQSLARSTGILRLLRLAERERLLPRVDDHFFFDRLGKVFPAHGVRRARVAFFSGCVANVTFAELNAATIRVLTANGCEVIVPGEQLCCGALAAHAGIRDIARQLARTNLRAFAAMEAGDMDAIVTNAAGCGSTLKEYDHLFTKDEPEYAQARAFANKTRDVTEFLAALGISAPLKSQPLRVTYQDSCHLLHGQKIREAPRALLRSIPGLHLVELPFSEICCGSAGVYNVTQTGAALDLLAEKMRYAQSTEAQIIATSNPGCLLQMRAGARLHGGSQQVLHVIELLDQASMS
ncbi:MAG: heterodisulfide reductase-related iron-sulfur binding cluster [Acidobacteriota bacterium]|nr:heterodisulfide reductase-related iron-sulfur binding cluster [Acidobacteriota bacterium]